MAVDGLPAYKIFVDPNGNDCYPGTVLAPKRTLYAGTQAAINAGGGMVCFNDYTPVGGPVTNQGLWLRNDGIAVPGFLNLGGARLRFVGCGQSGGEYVFERPGEARFFGATSFLGDFTLPGLWIVGSELPIDFEYVKNYVPSFYGIAAPARIGWDYIRANDGTIDQITVSSASRAAGLTELTLDLSTAAPYTITHASRASNVVTLTIQLGNNQNCTPWLIGSVIRVDTAGDTDFPGGDFQVTNQSDGFALQVLGGAVTVSYAQIGSTTSKSLSGAVRSSGCAVMDQIAFWSNNSEFPTTCMMKVVAINAADASKITVLDPYGYAPRHATTTQADAGAIAKHNRGRSAVSAVTFSRSTFDGNVATSGDDFAYGPAMDIGCVSANPIRLRECYFSGGLRWDWSGVGASHVNFDRCNVAVLCDPGAGTAGATGLDARDCQSQDGCVRIYGGRGWSGGNQALVNWWLQDSSGAAPVPTISVVEGTVFDTYTFDNIFMADGHAEAINIGSGLDGLRVHVGEVYSSHVPPIVNNSPICGPRNLRAANWTDTSAASPWQLGWQGALWTGGIAARHPGANRAMGPVQARFANLVPPFSSWQAAAPFRDGITITQDGLGPDGAATAFKIVATSEYAGLPIVVGYYPYVGSWSVGDHVAIGCWIRSPAGSDVQFLLNAYAPGNVQFDGQDALRSTKHIRQDGWQWCPATATITAITTGQYWIGISLPAGVGTYYLFAPMIVHAPSSIADADFFEWAGTFKHQPIYLPAGASGTMEDQKFVAHGGVGSGLAYVEGVASGQLTIVGSFTPKKYEPIYKADGTIKGWVELVDATINS